MMYEEKPNCDLEGDVELVRKLFADLGERALDILGTEGVSGGKDGTLVIISPTYAFFMPGPLRDEELGRDSMSLYQDVRSRLKKRKNKIKPIMSHVYTGGIAIGSDARRKMVISPASVNLWRGGLTAVIDGDKGLTVKDLVDRFTNGEVRAAILNDKIMMDVCDSMANTGMSNADIGLMVGVSPRQVQRYQADKRKELASAYQREGMEGAIGRLYSAYDHAYRSITSSILHAKTELERAKLAKMAFDITTSLVKTVDDLRRP